MAKVTRPLQKDRHYWLLKSDADSFSFDDLWNLPTRTTHWDGVRNFQARNFMRDEMKKGDLAFFYHSGGDNPGILGIVEIVREGYPDHTALDAKDPHYDPRSKSGESYWSMVDIQAIERLQDRAQATGVIHVLLPMQGGEVVRPVGLDRGKTARAREVL